MSGVGEAWGGAVRHDALSGFTGPLTLTLVEDERERAILRDGRCQWRLSRPLAFDVGREGSGETITAPTDFVTDLASIPVPFRDLLPPDGPWAKAAVVHDFLYFTGGSGAFGSGCYISRSKSYSRAEADEVLRQAMSAVGVPNLKAQLIYWAVRLGGAGGWGH